MKISQKFFPEALNDLFAEHPGLTNKEVSEATGVSETTLSRIRRNERGKRPWLSTTKPLAKYFKVRFKYFLEYRAYQTIADKFGYSVADSLLGSPNGNGSSGKNRTRKQKTSPSIALTFLTSQMAA